MVYSSIGTSQPQLRSSQHCHLLAVVATQPSGVLVPYKHSFSRLLQSQELNDATPGSPSPRPVGLCQLRLFCQLPLFLPHTHTIMMCGADVVGWGNLYGDIDFGFVIDELSLNKDECFAESVICNALGGKCFSILQANHLLLHLIKTFLSTPSSISKTQLWLHVGQRLDFITDYYLAQAPIQQSTEMGRNLGLAVLHQTPTSFLVPQCLKVSKELHTYLINLTNKIIRLCGRHCCSTPPAQSPASGIHPENVDPLQLGFYAPAIHNIIECAKQISHCDLTSLNLFPLRPQFNTKASEYINEAIVKCWSQGLIISDGKYVYHCPT